MDLKESYDNYVRKYIEEVEELKNTKLPPLSYEEWHNATDFDDWYDRRYEKRRYAKPEKKG